MKAKLVHEALESERTDVERLVRSAVSSARTMHKLLGHVELLYSFSPETVPLLDKKELTKIRNDFDGAVQNMYDRKTNRDTYRKELEALAEKKGYRSVYDAAEKRDPLFRTLQFPMVYSLLEAKRKHGSLEGLELTDEEKEFVGRYFPNLREWTALEDKMEEIRKIVAPNASEKQESKVQEIKGRVNPAIRSAIDEIAESFRLAIEETEYRFHVGRIDAFRREFPDGMGNEQFYDRKNDWITYSVGRFLKKPERMGGRRLLVDEPEAAARKAAEESSRQIIARWQGKMYDKLGGFMSGLDKKFTAEVIGQGARESDIVFRFEDGSKFTLKNQIVSKVSGLGNPFYQYPTTFHHAYLPDGSRVTDPNEFTVKKAFNDYSITIR